MKTKFALLTLILLPLSAEEPKPTPITGERRLKIENNQLRQQLLQKEIEALQRQVEAVAKPLAEDLKTLEAEACAWAKIPAPCKLDPQKMTVAAVPKPEPTEAKAPPKTDAKQAKN